MSIIRTGSRLYTVKDSWLMLMAFNTNMCLKSIAPMEALIIVKNIKWKIWIANHLQINIKRKGLSILNYLSNNMLIKRRALQYHLQLNQLPLPKRKTKRDHHLITIQYNLCYKDLNLPKMGKAMMTMMKVRMKNFKKLLIEGFQWIPKT